MIRRAWKLVRRPGTYVPLAINMAQQQASRLFHRTPYYMQAQMEIHPRSRWYNEAFIRATGGLFPKGDQAGREICDLEPWDNTRRDVLVLLLRTVLENKVAGDFAELGVYKGFTAKLIHHYAPERRLHLFDTFEGFTDKGAAAEKRNTAFVVAGSEFSDTSIDAVKQYVAARNDNVRYHPGYFPESVPADLASATFAFVHLDADLYEPTLEALKFFFPRTSQRGVLVIHDYNAWPGARRAVDDFLADKAEFPLPMPDKTGSAVIVKQ